MAISGRTVGELSVIAPLNYRSLTNTASCTPQLLFAIIPLFAFGPYISPALLCLFRSFFFPTTISPSLSPHHTHTTCRRRSSSVRPLFRSTSSYLYSWPNVQLLLPSPAVPASVPHPQETRTSSLLTPDSSWPTSTKALPLLLPSVRYTSPASLSSPRRSIAHWRGQCDFLRQNDLISVC